MQALAALCNSTVSVTTLHSRRAVLPGASCLHVGCMWSLCCLVDA